MCESAFRNLSPLPLSYQPGPKKAHVLRYEDILFGSPVECTLTNSDWVARLNFASALSRRPQVGRRFRIGNVLDRDFGHLF
jgi:hypothetical protein